MTMNIDKLLCLNDFQGMFSNIEWLANKLFCSFEISKITNYVHDSINDV